MANCRIWNEKPVARAGGLGLWQRASYWARKRNALACPSSVTGRYRNLNRAKTILPKCEPVDNRVTIDLKLKWATTWTDKENDFVAMDRRMKGGVVGRIYHFSEGPTKGKWFWSLTAAGKQLAPVEGQSRGHAYSAKEAAADVEKAWFSSARNVPDDVPDGAVGS